MIKRLFLISFCLCFVMQTVHAGIVEPVFKQFKDPNQDGVNNVPSTVSIQITPDGKKMFLLDHLENAGSKKVYIYDLTTPFDISTLDVTNRTIVSLDGYGDNMVGNNDNKDIEFNNDGTKVFFFSEYGTLQIHNLTTPYDVASISSSTVVADDGLNYKTKYSVNNIKGVEFNNDGTKMYFVDGTQNATKIAQINLSTPFDPTSGTKVHTLDTEPAGVAFYTMEPSFDDDGTRLYISEALNNSTGATTYMYVYKLSNPFELSSATFAGKWPITANGRNISAYSWTFGNNGMKAYIATEDANADGDDIIYEYDLTCPYGIVLCETDAVTAIGAQVEIAKNVIHQNSSTIFKRFDWLRRNDERANLTNHEVKLNINNPILAALKTNFENSLKNIQFTPASLKKENTNKNKKNWSHWSHVDVSFGRVGDTGSSKPKEVDTWGVMYGLDKLVNSKIFGYAFRYGIDQVDLEDGSSNELESHTFSLNMYSSVPLKRQSNLNLLLGVSYLRIDQLDKKNRETGERNGKQIYTSISYENENAFTKYDLIPFGKFEVGITQFSDYTNFDLVSNNIENHERLKFRTGNASAGLKFDSILYLKDKTLSRNGFIEYIYDLTPDIDHNVRSHIDNVSVKKTIKTHSLHNVKGNVGFEYMNSKGSTIAINYERFQSLHESGHKDSLLIKLGTAKKQNANFDVIYDPTNNNKTEISYLKNFGNFKLKLKSNYNLFSKIPDYGANIEFSGTF